MTRIRTVRPSSLLYTMALAVAALAMLCASPLSAQTTARGTFVALPDAFPDIDARAIVIRERGRDVVVLRTDAATPDALAMSLAVLERARRRAPSPSTGEMIPITGFALTKELTRGEQRRLHHLLERLRERPSTDVGTLGAGRWIRYSPR